MSGQSLGTSGETSENLSLHPDPSPQDITKEDSMQTILELSAPCSDSDKEGIASFELFYFLISLNC